MISQVDSFKSSYLPKALVALGGDLPPALAEMTEDKPEWVKKQAERYYAVLVRYDQIDPEDVTPEEFLSKSRAIAKNDPTFRAWEGQMLDTVLALDTQLTNSRNAREQERQAFNMDVFIRSRELDEKLARKRAGAPD